MVSTATEAEDTGCDVEACLWCVCNDLEWVAHVQNVHTSAWRVEGCGRAAAVVAVPCRAVDHEQQGLCVFVGPSRGCTRVQLQTVSATAEMCIEVLTLVVYWFTLPARCLVLVCVCGVVCLPCVGELGQRRVSQAAGWLAYGHCDKQSTALLA
jgi:hypothetical protein